MTQHTDAEIRQVEARVVAVAPLSPDYFVLTLLAPYLAETARPGQFAQLRVARRHTLDPLLARPISIYHTDPASGQAAFLVKIVGRGTTILSQITPGEAITVLGPLGVGFTIPRTVTALGLVAGGVGMPPMYALAAAMKQRRPALPIILFYGGRSQADLLELPRWQALGVIPRLATDDGSVGYHGLVTVPLQDAVANREIDFVAACGPRPMLRAVQGIALDAGLPGQLSLEAHMACGVGACLGCVCATVTGNRRVCVDGPVFGLEEVVFNA